MDKNIPISIGYNPLPLIPLPLFPLPLISITINANTASSYCIHDIYVKVQGGM